MDLTSREVKLLIDGSASFGTVTPETLYELLGLEERGLVAMSRHMYRTTAAGQELVRQDIADAAADGHFSDDGGEFVA